MSLIEWKSFKSGTDIRGIASDGVKGEPITLTDEAVKAMASGFALWLSEKTNKNPNELSISVGHDSRISADRIKTAVIAELIKAGIKVFDCALSSTPAMFMTTIDLSVDGAIQITASHHPFNRNGLKFFTRDGGLEGSDISAILNYCENGETPAQSAEGTVETVNYMDKYSIHLQNVIKKGVNSDNYDKPLDGFKIVVDAGNGAGGFYAEKVLAELGADVRGSQFLEPDGMFPNHVPNPENAEAMQSVSDATIAAKADLGVIFDTDVDRGGAVDSSGQEINRNRLIALAAVIVLEENEGGTIVTDSTTSTGLTEFINKNLGGVHYRYRRGYRNVINKSIELNSQGINSPLAIETSGHAALRENYFLDDGAYLVTKIIIKMAKLKKLGLTLSDLTKDLKEALEEKEYRLKILRSDFASYGNSVIKELEQYASVQSDWRIADDNREGIRVFFDDEERNGWFLVRLSVHDPIIPINIESYSEGGVAKIAQTLKNFLSSYDGLDISTIN